MNVLHHLAVQFEALVILLQQTHCASTDKLVIPSFALAGYCLNRIHGLAAFVHERLKWTLVDQSPFTSETEWLCVDVDGYKIVNVYKPPPTPLQTTNLPVFPHPVKYSGDFNCPHVNWGYSSNSAALMENALLLGQALMVLSGPDSICPELLLHAGAALKSWLCGFLSSCLHHLKIQKIWRRALVVAIPKPMTPVKDPKSYHPISLLCVPYKILERLIYTRIEPIVDPLLPREQAGFRQGRSTVDQTVLLTQHIEDSFETKKKAGAVFVDLTAAYDTVWHRGLTCKLLRLLPDKHMVQMIMELIRNRSFTLSIGDSKRSRLRRLRNGLPQRLVLAPLLFNIYTYDLPSTISQKYAYADDLALMHTSKDWKTLEGTLSQDMTTLSAYLQTWRLKLSHTTTVTTAFHLNNREAKRELKIFNNGKLLPYCPTPTYLGVKLDRSLTFRHHLEALRKKLSTRVTLLRRLAGSGWGAGAKTLRTAALSLVYSTAEYCAPVWCRSAHTRLIDSVLNDALRIVTGCLRPTPTDYLPILAGIQPAELRRRGATLSLANRATLNPDHILHEQLVGKQNAHQGRLKSRRPFVPAVPTETTG